MRVAISVAWNASIAVGLRLTLFDPGGVEVAITVTVVAGAMTDTGVMIGFVWGVVAGVVCTGAMTGVPWSSDAGARELGV